MEVIGQLHAPAALPAGKEPPRRLGVAQSHSGRGGEENIPAFAGSRDSVVFFAA